MFASHKTLCFTPTKFNWLVLCRKRRCLL